MWLKLLLPAVYYSVAYTVRALYSITSVNMGLSVHYSPIQRGMKTLTYREVTKQD